MIPPIDDMYTRYSCPICGWAIGTRKCAECEHYYCSRHGGFYPRTETAGLQQWYCALCLNEKETPPEYDIQEVKRLLNSW